jgi:hypothetical protein
MRRASERGNHLSSRNGGATWNDRLLTELIEEGVLDVAAA